MNIEEIKKRYDGNAYKPYFADLFGENKEYFSTHNDIFYLLSIIEEAEKAFEEINYQFELYENEVIDNAIKKVDDIATEALQAIRKGD